MATTDVQRYSDLSSTDINRSVHDFLSVLVKNYPIMEMVNFQTDRVAVGHKFEWFDQLFSQRKTNVSTDITAHAANATGISVEVDDYTIFKIGDQLRIEGLEPIYQITATPASSTLTCKEVRGIALGSDAGSGAMVKFDRGELEITSYDDDNFEGADFGDNYYNYTQIFRRDIQVSESAIDSALKGGVYTVNDLVSLATEQQLKRVAWQMYEAVTRGVKTERTGSTIRGMMGGIREFINISGGNVLSSSGAITLDKLNTAVGYVYDDAADLSNLVMVIPTHHNKTLATLDSNYFRYIDPADARSIGSNVTRYIPDIAQSGGIPIIVDPNMPKSEVWFVDRSQIFMVPKIMMEVRDAPTPGTTALRKYLFGEYTLMVRHGKTMHACIKGLDTT